jgi:sugar phosphate isomerase/epimerase
VSDASFAVSTFLFHQSRLDREHLVHIAAHGFGGVEIFALRSHFDYGDPVAVAQLGEWLDDTRLQLAALHAPTADRFEAGVWSGNLSVASTDAAVRSRAVAEIQKALNVAKVLPYRTLVLHLGSPAQVATTHDNEAAAARRSLDVIVPYAADCGVQVALEVQTNALSTPDALVSLIEDAGDWPLAGICLDVGHARRSGRRHRGGLGAHRRLPRSRHRRFARRPSGALRRLGRLDARPAGLPEGGLLWALDVRTRTGRPSGRHPDPRRPGPAAFRAVSRYQ